MKAFVTRTQAGLDSLQIEHLDSVAVLGPEQVRVAIRAVSLNHRDLLFIAGVFKSPHPDYSIPCSDAAGEVIETGPGVWRVSVGDRVALNFYPDWIGGPWQPAPPSAGRGGGRQGVMCEESVVHQSELVVLAPHLSFAEGACLPCAGVTAWRALCGAGPLLPGMTVLTQGGGGVSVFAIQLAKLFGARVIATSSSPERCENLRELGADHVIDYQRDPDWDVAVRGLTGGLGADVTVEVGGAATIDRSLAATRRGGQLAMVGLLTGMPSITASMFGAGVQVTPSLVGSRADLEAMNRAIGFHQVHPVIDSRFAFEKFPDALRYLQSGRQLGKVVVRLD